MEPTRQPARALAGLLLALLALDAHADPKAGEAKAQLCLLCHKPESGMPLLEAQPATYLVAATVAYQQGRRSDPQMQANVRRLSARDVADIADYFAAQAPPAGRAAAPHAGRSAAGEARLRELQCGSCHQPDYIGRGLVPRLAGQASGYLASQIEAYVAGRRKHPAAAMPAAAEIDAIAGHLAALR